MTNREFMEQCFKTIDSIGSKDSLNHQAYRLKIMASIFVELQKAREQFKAFQSFHEAYAIIKEELDEFWDEVKEKPYVGRFENIQKELIQTAAMCVRALLDLNIEHANEGNKET